MLTGKGCSPLPLPPWHIAVTSAVTEADWRSPSAWTWWQTGPTRWSPGTPGRGRGGFHNAIHTAGEQTRVTIKCDRFSFNGSPEWRVCKFQDGGILIKHIIGSWVSKHKCDYASSQESYSRNVQMKQRRGLSLSECKRTSSLRCKCILGKSVRGILWQHSCWLETAQSSPDFPTLTALKTSLYTRARWSH